MVTEEERLKNEKDVLLKMGAMAASNPNINKLLNKLDPKLANQMNMWNAQYGTTPTNQLSPAAQKAHPLLNNPIAKSFASNLVKGLKGQDLENGVEMLGNFANTMAAGQNTLQAKLQKKLAGMSPAAGSLATAAVNFIEKNLVSPNAAPSTPAQSKGSKLAKLLKDSINPSPFKK